MVEIGNKMLKKDLIATLHKYPGLQLISLNKIQGIYQIKDDLDVIQGEYSIEITIPSNYPFECPKLYEVSTKIPRNDDRHINKYGLACVEIEQKILLRLKKGLSILNFIEEYVHKYFCWQLRYDAGDFENLKEWSHNDGGTLEFYMEVFSTEDIYEIVKFLQIIIEGKLPRRNDSCICGKEKNYKRCHMNAVEYIMPLGNTMLFNDSKTLLLHC